MRKLKRIRKILTNVLILLVLFINAACFAASAADTPDQEGASQEGVTFALDNTALQRDAAVNQNQTSDWSALEAGNSLLSYYLQDAKNNGQQWLKTTDIQLKLMEDDLPVFSLETIQPFGGSGNNGSLWFWQGRYSNQNADNTANLGVGWRKLSDDQSGVIGFNAFYDYGFQYNLSRLGIGAEYFNGLLESRINYYLPLSGDKMTGGSELENGVLYSYIRAVEGYDYELGFSVPRAPWWRLYASGFYYDNRYSEDETGYRLRSAMQFTPYFALELSYQTSNLGQGGFSGTISYQLGNAPKPALFADGNPSDQENRDISYQLLQKVERDNAIKTETFTRFISYIGNLSVRVTDSDLQPIRGAMLQAYQNGNAAGDPVVTDANGTGVIGGLNVGAYTVKATYFSYAGDSSPVTVQKDQTASATVVLPIVGAANAIVRVRDSQLQPVGGVRVTAHGADGGETTISEAAAGFTLAAPTGSDGKAQFTNLPSGSYYFSVTVNGQTMTSSPITVSGGNTSNVEIVLTSGNNNGSAVITVTDGNAGLSGATVSVTVNGALQAATTNGSGVAAFVNIPAGSHTFTASMAEYTGSTANVSVASGVTAAGTITLNAIGNATVTVTFSDGATNVTPAFTLDSETHINFTNIVSGEGTSIITYQFNNLPTGGHTIAAAATDYTASGAAAVTVSKGATTAGTDITLSRDTGNAAVTVTISDGASVTPGFTVDGAARTPDDISGNTYTFNNLPTGGHTIAAAATDYTASGAAAVTVSKGATTAGTDITLSRDTGNAAVTVTISDGASVTPGFTVDGAARTPDDISGNTYTFNNLPTGGHTIAAAATDYTASGAAAVTVSKGATTAGTDITLSRDTGNAAVTVTISDGASVTPGFTVDGTARTPDDISGNTYIFNNLPTGSHTIAAAATGYTASGAAAVTVSKGATTAGPDITLIRDTGNATITVIMLSSPQSNWNVKLNGTTIATGTDGQATFNNLPTGTYSVMATKSTTSTNMSITANVTVAKSGGDITVNASDYYDMFYFNITNSTANICRLELSDGSSTRIIWRGNGDSAGIMYAPKGNWKYYHDEYSNTSFQALKQFPTTNNLVIN